MADAGRELERMLDLVNEGDAEAYSSLVSILWRRIVATIWYRLRKWNQIDIRDVQECDLEDALQAALIELWNNVNAGKIRFESVDHFVNSVALTSCRRLFDLIRRRDKVLRLEDEFTGAPEDTLSTEGDCSDSVPASVESLAARYGLSREDLDFAKELKSIWETVAKEKGVSPYELDEKMRDEVFRRAGEIGGIQAGSAKRRWRRIRQQIRIVDLFEEEESSARFRGDTVSFDELSERVARRHFRGVPEGKTHEDYYSEKMAEVRRKIMRVRRNRPGG